MDREELVERGGWEKGRVLVCFLSPLDMVDKVKGLDEAYTSTERTDNRKGIAAVNLAREKVP